MKRKAFYLIALLVILAGVIVPALCMDKVFSSGQQSRQTESTGINAEEQGSPANQNRPDAGDGLASPEPGKVQPADETRQGDPAPEQQAAASTSDSQTKAAVTQTSDDAAATVQTAGDTVAAAAPDNGCAVWIAIVGKNSELLYRAGQVVVGKDNKWGITALGVLDATGIPYTTSPTWPDFVYSISGQANSGVSGWMYSVNGDVPMHMADKHPVKAGDKVIWWYSNSMDQPQPQWEELAQ
ncbi:hypothetical protein Psch_01377 [Pelotomaculum schinkii]|uniref:Transcobalamin-like C-terminal domain-containing protein n=1 Tax=Pelotomaculum schinkii TaxID=78350 RepID=A0A4Y7RGJ5_9FIRM|nr:DUF4430 domain-containing protein [Pelotomaculum schinkii]TEB07822.1 hypothetical protein Psch_01377 [Pelotomaculum schinkii]